MSLRSRHVPLIIEADALRCPVLWRNSTVLVAHIWWAAAKELHYNHVYVHPKLRTVELVLWERGALR